jgi:phage repressor protein C with HTH and peptisase S24 domain
MTLRGFFRKPNRLKPLLLRQIVGSSMLPKLRDGRVLVASGWFGRLRPHDLVIISHEGREKIKRIRHIDNQKLYVVGDNEAASTDSRDFGWLPLEAVSAKVIWPRIGQS